MFCEVCIVIAVSGTGNLGKCEFVLVGKFKYFRSLLAFLTCKVGDLPIKNVLRETA